MSQPDHEHLIRVEHRLYVNTDADDLPGDDGTVALLQVGTSEATDIEATYDDMVDSWASVIRRLPPDIRAALGVAIRRVARDDHDALLLDDDGADDAG